VASSAAQIDVRHSLEAAQSRGFVEATAIERSIA
jgi:hypothetical protein